MKKLTIATLAFALFFGIANAYSPEGIDDVSHENYALNPLGSNNLQQINSNFLKAIQNRHQRYFRNKYRAEQGNWKNIYNQRLQHAASKSVNNVNDVQTTVKRGGPLTDRSGIRENTAYRAQRSNAKQTFRARAICYYVDGTDANSDCLKSGVIDGEKHRVITNPITEAQHREKISVVNANARRLVREAAKAARSDAETADRKFNYLKGSSNRMFLSPFYRLAVE